jgi:hypothetical protein
MLMPRDEVEIPQYGHNYNTAFFHLSRVMGNTFDPKMDVIGTQSILQRLEGSANHMLGGHLETRNLKPS